MPDWKQVVRTHLPNLRATPTREAEMIEELAIQLELAYQEALRAGHDASEAERMAIAQLPGAGEINAALPERHRPASRMWQGIPGDLRHAVRVLRKSPVFTAVAIATIAIGIGGCTAMFSLLEAVILRPIAYRQPDQLVMVWENQRRLAAHRNVVAPADYLDWKARSHVFSDMSPILDQIWNVTGQGDPVVLKGVAVDDRFLPMVGQEPLLGRGFTPEEAGAGGPNVVIISHGVWVSRFGARGNVLGQSISLDGRPHTIIGVLPAGFPWLGKPLDVLTPTQFPKLDWRVHAGRFLRVAARLRPGVTRAQAQNELSAIARQLEVEYPSFNKDWGVELEPMADNFASGAGTGLWVLMGAVGLVLLIACANVANLMLARAVVREREMALRAALGATRQRLVRLLLIESLTISLTGGALGCAGAYAVIRLVQTYGPQDIGRLDAAGVNFAVAVFALAASLITGTVFGLAPALAAGRLDLSATLKDGGRGTLSTLRGERLRGVFVVSQVALALVLLTGASLLMQSLYRLSSLPPGFDAHNVLTGTVMFSGRIEDAKLGAMCTEIVSRLRGLPGVENAGFVTWLPFAGMGAATDFRVVGRPPNPPGQDPVTDVRVVQPGYFETMRIPLVRGRLFTDADNRGDAPWKFVINEELAQRMFGKGKALGESLIVDMGNNTPGQIIGVVGDTKQLSLDGATKMTVYYVQAHLPISFGSFVMRTRVKPELMTSAMVAAIRSVKKDQPVTDTRSMDDWVGKSLARTRFQTGLLSAFALIAMVLAVIGVYGVMAYSVEQRTHEIGVRLALGAEPGALKRWIAARGMRLAAAGLTLGVIGAAGATRALRSLLYGIEPGDPETYVAAAFLLAMACLAASYIPARRATVVDPAVALRQE